MFLVYYLNASLHNSTMKHLFGHKKILMIFSIYKLNILKTFLDYFINEQPLWVHHCLL
jgi:hypothetical protein